VDKVDDVWSKPKNIGMPINTKAHEFYLSLTNNGDLFFTAERAGVIGREDIFVSRLKEGVYQEPTSIKGGVNTKYFEFNAYVSPNESYLIFSGNDLEKEKEEAIYILVLMKIIFGQKPNY